VVSGSASLHREDIAECGAAKLSFSTRLPTTTSTAELRKVRPSVARGRTPRKAAARAIRVWVRPCPPCTARRWSPGSLTRSFMLRGTATSAKPQSRQQRSAPGATNRRATQGLDVYQRQGTLDVGHGCRGSVLTCTRAAGGGAGRGWRLRRTRGRIRRGLPYRRILCTLPSGDARPAQRRAELCKDGAG